MTQEDKFNSPVYWQIGTDIKLSFPTKKEYEEAKKRVYKTLPILCNTCLHENNCDGQCGFAENKTNNIEMMGNCVSCTYYDATEMENNRLEKLRKQVQKLGITSILDIYKITNPKLYKVYIELLGKYGVQK